MTPTERISSKSVDKVPKLVCFGFHRPESVPLKTSPVPPLYPIDAAKVTFELGPALIGRFVHPPRIISITVPHVAAKVVEGTETIVASDEAGHLSHALLKGEVLGSDCRKGGAVLDLDDLGE
jgi:hypothetical protein